ncbi:MAG: dockerin type I repeat-containing protein [Clostridia bacterium]|nr:dockerin type I repeat-containing protein [Clostridia bacterium]
MSWFTMYALRERLKQIIITINHNSQFVVWVIPIVLEVEVKVGGEIVLNISFDEDRKVTFDDTTLTLTASLNASAGVGCSVASFGVYGSIGTVFVLDIYPEFGIESWEANGEIGGYVKVVFKKYSKKFASFDGYIIEPKDQQQVMMRMSTYDMAAMYLIDNYTNAEASELENDFKLIVIDGMLYKLGYMDASSLEGYDAYNYAKLCISSWDGEKWSDPTIIDDNGRNDAAYSIYNHDGVLVLTYTQVADILTANDDNYESFDNLVIKTIPLTTQSIATIGEGNVVDTSIERDYYVYLAQYAIVDGIPTLVWVENADNNAFGVSPDNYIDANGISHVFATTANSIWMSKFENGTWGTPISIASGLSAVTDVAIGTDGDIAYIVDTNGNLADMTDRVMFYGNTGDTISAYNHISVGSMISVDFADGEFVYYYDLVNEDEENIDGLRTLSGIEGSADQVESYPAEVPADYKVVEDAEGNVIAVFFFSTKTWEYDGEKVSGSALYGIFKQDGVWGKPIEIVGVSNESGVRFETTMDRYIYSYDVIVTPSEDSALMISVSTVDQNGCDLENYDFIYRMEGRIVVDNYEVNYADSTVSIPVQNVGARTSEVYVSIGNGYLLIDKALASGEIKTYTISLYGNADRKYTVSIDGDKIGTPDWTSEELNLNYSDIVPYAKQLLVGGKNVLLLAVKNTGNTVDTGITVIRVGEHMDNAIISAEILNAISHLTLNDGESAIVEITNENGEKEKIWVGTNVVDAYGIAYHEVMLSDLCSENIGIISIATIVTDNEKGVAVDNNFTHVSYNECVGSLEEGENVEYKPTIFENTLEFDQQNDDGVELNYTYSADDSVLEVYVDQIKVSNELYENTMNGTRGTMVLHLELLNSLSKGTHKVTLNFASGNTCEIELKVVSYYTVTVNNGESNLPEISVKEGTIPMLPTVSKAADEQYTYVFNGWDVDGDMMSDNITAVTENTTYTAIWKKIKREYEITWVMVSKDGKSVSVTGKYHYEDIPQYIGTVFAPDGMQFVSWNTEIDKVTQNCTYTAQYEQEREIGDINGDGVINTRDVAMLRQYVVGKIELSEDVLVYCNIYNDYNDDGSVKINTRDVALLQQIVVGTSN